MRVTNSMISNNSQIHIGNAKTELMRREDQYTTQKKIQRPSDDPTVAIRSLQLRTTYVQIEQYSEKNVKDAMDWMDTTESAMKKIDSILTDMKGYFGQGANDPLDAKQRSSVLSALREFATSVFEDNANADFSGRYMFTGYRTDTSLLFPETTENLEYKITEHLNSTDIDAIKVVSGSAKYVQGRTAQEYAGDYPEESKAYRMQLAYDNLVQTKDLTNPNPDFVPNSDEPTADISLKLSGRLVPGQTMDITANVKTKSSQATDAYIAGAGEVIYLYDTGELVFSSEVYDQIQEYEASVDVTYLKNEFDKGDIRPEMYFESTSYNTSSKKEVYYADPSGQDIRYEINFSQTGVVNTQAKDAISTDIYRAVDYLALTVQEMVGVETRIDEIEKKISNTTADDEIENLSKLKEMLEQEKKLRQGAMQEAFSKGLTMVERAQNQINVAIADLGSRYKRMQLTDDKLGDLKIDTEQKLSNNEDVDIADAYINLTQADNLYQASLSATAKILGNSLLNYI